MGNVTFVEDQIGGTSICHFNLFKIFDFKNVKHLWFPKKRQKATFKKNALK
jgi:hypothetical protein